MNRQHYLFASDFPPSPHPDLNRLQAAVLKIFRGAGPDGLTDEQAQLRMTLKSQSQAPRRGELEEMGLIVWTGNYRRTASGRWAKVWAVSQ